MNHSREVYTLIDLFGNYGGIVEVIVLLLSLFVSPVADFSLFVVLMEKFYKIKSKKQPTIFIQPNAQI